MNSLSPEVALNRITPELRPLLSSVVRNGRVGLDSSSCLRITDLKTGCTTLTPGPCCDRFKLHIPYAGETLKWDIIFNARDPELPPDFIFGEDAEFLPEPSELPCRNAKCPEPPGRIEYKVLDRWFGVLAALQRIALFADRSLDQATGRTGSGPIPQFAPLKRTRLRQDSAGSPFSGEGSAALLRCVPLGPSEPGCLFVFVSVCV
ncbi:hypothetical protein Z043_103087 [Scleropages formosus]|uniref:BRISC and BRCA1-A complex member 2 n=1 Tax=Scleropages formosus TaxID=113540 RepID=A0A0N8K2E2_SCLFO|nr:hypothetical protein Z043_103087 [Scleropages formosus]